MSKENGQSGDSDEQRLTFHYIKSNGFRVIHVDGVHGGLTPNLKVQMALFSERSPIPQQVVHRVEPGPTEGTFKLGEEVKEARVERKDIVREVEAEVVMDPAVAKSVAEWLSDKAKTAEEAMGKLKAERGASP